MSSSWIIITTFAGTALMSVAIAQLVYDWLLRYRVEVRARLEELSGDVDSGNADVTLFRNIASKRFNTTHRGFGERLANVFHQAGIKGSGTKLALWSLGCGALLAVPMLWREVWWSVAAFVGGGLVPLMVLYARRHFRSRALSRQLPEAFEMMSRAVRAGQTVPAAMQIIAEDFDQPISDEFKLCYEQQDLGMSRDTALHQLAERTGIMELRIFVVALVVQARYGGDLAKLLDNLATMIRKRFKLSERVRALTGEGRIQAMVLTILPIVAFVGIMIIAPDYLEALLSRPWMLAVTVAAQIAGLVWIQRIVRFDV